MLVKAFRSSLQWWTLQRERHSLEIHLLLGSVQLQPSLDTCMSDQVGGLGCVQFGRLTDYILKYWLFTWQQSKVCHYLSLNIFSELPYVLVNRYLI